MQNQSISAVTRKIKYELEKANYKYNLLEPQEAAKFWDNEWDSKHDPLAMDALKKVDFRV